MADPRESQARLVAGVKLSVKFPEDTDFALIAEVTKVPEVGATGSQVDVTTILDTQRVYIAGLPDPGEGSFPVNFVGKSPQHQKVFAAQYKMPKDTVEFKLEFPDGTIFEFPVEISGVKFTEGTPGNALAATVTYAKKGEATATWPTTTP